VGGDAWPCFRVLLFELIGGKAAVNGTFGPAVGCVDGKNAGGNVWMPGALSVGKGVIGCLLLSVGKGVIGCLFTLACVGASVAAWVVLVSLSSLVEATKIAGAVESFTGNADEKEGALVTCRVGNLVVVKVALGPLDCSTFVISTLGLSPKLTVGELELCTRT